MIRIYFILLLFAIKANMFSQGIIRGKVADENGETLIGVTIGLKSDLSIGTVTDIDGNYSLDIPNSNVNIIVIEYVGFDLIEETITVLNGEVVLRDFTMRVPAQTINEVVVVAKQERAQVYYMENLKKRSSVSIDYISAETMKKIGDSNVTAAISRVSGVSTNGGFITIRGIGDRYVKTTINGSLIPTLDPFTNNIKLDLFPSSLVDNIVITKTASPDLPGDFTAAYISVDTKDFPDQFSLNVESQVGYNSQSNFQNVLANNTSKTDWLGYDNSYRNIDHNNFDPYKDISKYDEFKALGLGDFYKSIGINGKWNEGNEAGISYIKLGMIELGLMGKSELNDPAAYNRALERYISDGYQKKAFEILNKDVVTSNKNFADNWNIFRKRAPLNFSQTFSIGQRLQLFGRELGLIAGFRYSSSIQNDENGRITRTLRDDLDTLGNAVKIEDNAVIATRYINGWSGLINASYKYSKNHSFTFMIMPNFNGANNIRDGIDRGISSPRTQHLNTHFKSQFYEQRKQFIYQLKSDHFIPSLKTKINLSGSYTNGVSSSPDFKTAIFFSDKGIDDKLQYVIDGTQSRIRRNFRDLSEDVLDAKINLEKPINEKEGFVRKVKIGSSYLSNIRRFNQFDYALVSQKAALDFKDKKLNLDEVFQDNDFNINVDQDGRGYISAYYEGEGKFNQYLLNNQPIFRGRYNIFSGFAMVDYMIDTKIRIAGGLRVENVDLISDVYKFDVLKYTKNDPRRLFERTIANAGVLNKVSFLPSVNVIYTIKKDEISPTNLRLNYSQTVARPSLREYTSVYTYDFELQSDVFGNPDLKMVTIDNYDLRLESYNSLGDNISLSLFYKNFRNHIELFETGAFTWFNADNSNVKGVEIEGRKKLNEHFEFKTNLSFVDSKTTYVSRNPITNEPIDTINRKMFGQAPFVINCIINGNFDELGIDATLSYNLQGPRLVLAGDALGSRDVFEMPRHLFDLKVSKKINSKFSTSFVAKDILNTSIRRSYRYESGYIEDFDRFRFGTNYSLSLNYKI
jgi:hypothetical protein